MPQRSEALYRDRIIGIESIFTVIDGKQINIPERLKDLRVKSRSNELFCPCGCGNNLILVAGDKNLREQHFREKHSEDNHNCTYRQEGATSIYSKIVLKCWLEDKLKADDIEDHVPVSAVGDTKRQYEFSFLSRSKKIAVNYCRKRENLSDEKLEILDANTRNIRVIHVVDSANADTGGQYPEGLMKVQSRQGYGLFLEVDDYDYFKASMRAVFYTQDLDGLWKELAFAKGMLAEFDIVDNGEIRFCGQSLVHLLTEEQQRFDAEQLVEQKKREEAEARRREQEVRRLEKLQKRREEEAKRQAEWEDNFRRRKEEYELEQARQAEEAEKIRIERELKKREEVARREEERRQREDDFKKNIAEGFIQQETKVFDSDGKQWFRCEYCGKIASEEEFPIHGGIGKFNLGTCKACIGKLREKRLAERTETTKPHKNESYRKLCPNCQVELVKREGRYGLFLACPNYPACRFTRNI